MGSILILEQILRVQTLTLCY